MARVREGSGGFVTQEGKIETGAGETRRLPWLDIVVLAVIGLVLVVFFRVVGMYLAIALNIAWRLIVRRPVHHNQRLLWTCVFGAPVAFVVVTLIAAPFSPAMLHAPWLRSAIDVAVIPMPLDRILLTLLGEEVPGGDWIMTQFAKPVWYAQFYTPLYPAIFLGFCAGMAWFAVMLPVSFGTGEVRHKAQLSPWPPVQVGPLVIMIVMMLALGVFAVSLSSNTFFVAESFKSNKFSPVLFPPLALLAIGFLAKVLERSISKFTSSGN